MSEHDELIEQVAKAIKNADQTTWKHTQEYHTFEDSAWEEMVDDTERVPYEGISLGRDHFRTMAAASIALVRADERKRIREALLSPEVVEAAAKALADIAANEGWNWYSDDDGDAQFPGWDDIADDDRYMGEGDWMVHGRDHFRKQAAAALTATGIRKETGDE